MQPASLEPADLPADAVEVGRIQGAWGVKGWLKVHSHSASPEALFSSKRWFLLPSDRPGSVVPFVGSVRLSIREAKEHARLVVATAHEVGDRDFAEALKGARVFVARSSFPTPGEGEYYWVDLIGLAVVNREGEPLGTVSDLITTGPQQVLVITYQTEPAKTAERLIPFVDAYVDDVDLDAKRITVDWQLDY